MHRCRSLRPRVGATSVAAAAAALACVLAALAMAALAAEKAPEPPGTALIEVRSPDGRPLASSDVEVDFTGEAARAVRGPLSMEAIRAKEAGRPPPVDFLHSSLRTNDKGVVAVNWPLGVSGCRIEVRGVGFAATGSVEIPPGATVKVRVPPLAAYGAIPSDRSNPVRSGFSPEIESFRWIHPEPAAPAQGLSLTGKVVDLQGRPVADAIVYAVYESTHFTRHYMGPASDITTTDKDGTYRFENIFDHAHNVALCAQVKDRPPALAFAAPDMASGQPAAAGANPQAASVDIIVPDKGGALDVQVLADGKPAEHATVRLQAVEWNAFLGLGGMFSTKVLEALFSPQTTTDSAGTARFENLVPGRYDVEVASEGTPAMDATMRTIRQMFSGARPETEVKGIQVAQGEHRRVSVAVAAQDCSAVLRAFLPDGRLAAGHTYQWECHPAGKEPRGRGAATLNEVGIDHLYFQEPGLWRVAVQVRDTSFEASPAEEPFDEAEAVVACSPNLPPQPTINFYTVLRHCGSLEVTLQDLDGKPARGTVELSNYAAGEAAYAGTTDAAGRIVFTDLPCKDYYVWACDDRPTAPPPLSIDRADSQLEGRAMYLDKKATVRSDTCQVSLRLQPVGFVRGRMKPVPGVDLGKVELAPAAPERSEVGTRVIYNRARGEYIVGPCLPGKVALRLGFVGDDGPYDAGQAVLDVAGGKVTHADLAPLPREEMKLMSSFAGEQNVSGQVLLADGKTPAWAACVLRVTRGRHNVHSLGWTDASGHFATQRQTAYPRETDEETDPPGSPAGDVVLAWLPGQCGAAFVPVGKGTDLHVVLPPAMKAEGRVTVGGKAASDYRGTIHVLARHEGLGRLDEWMDISTTANHDGSFALYGLSPGAYTVQAALDDVWLSQGVKVTVKDAGPAPLKLDVPAPGASAVLKIECAGGAVLKDVALTVSLPAGPLTDRIRPKVLRTDAAGRVLLAGLPAGENRLGLEGLKGEFKVVIPAPGPTAPLELRLQVGAE